MASTPCARFNNPARESLLRRITQKKDQLLRHNFLFTYPLKDLFYCKRKKQVSGTQAQAGQWNAGESGACFFFPLQNESADGYTKSEVGVPDSSHTLSHGSRG